MKGKLIFLFGIDGSGKSTILQMLKDSKLDNIICTSCLTSAIFEEELYDAERKLHFSRKDIFSKEFKHVLHIGSVIYKMYNEILPFLNDGHNIILDRYVICIKMFSELFLNPSCQCLSNALECLPIPDLGIYFDADIDIAIQRIQERSKKNGIVPHYSESRESLRRKKIYYESMIDKERYAILKLDANRDVDNVYYSILQILQTICII